MTTVIGVLLVLSIIGMLTLIMLIAWEPKK